MAEAPRQVWQPYQAQQHRCSHCSQLRTIGAGTKPNRLRIVFGTIAESDPNGIDYDCNDFETQEEAQQYFDSQGGSPSNNVDDLDGNDRDGIVRENLP
jgi:hypothetical protein